MLRMLHLISFISVAVVVDVDVDVVVDFASIISRQLPYFVAFYVGALNDNVVVAAIAYFSITSYICCSRC